MSLILTKLTKLFDVDEPEDVDGVTIIYHADSWSQLSQITTSGQPL